MHFSNIYRGKKANKKHNSGLRDKTINNVCDNTQNVLTNVNSVKGYGYKYWFT